MRNLLLAIGLVMATTFSALAQSSEFVHKAVLVENRSASFVVRVTAESLDKKKATALAAMSALDTYLFYGIEGVNDGKPLLDKQALTLSPDYFERLYKDGRYSVFMRSVVEESKPKKMANGKFSATALVEIAYRPLLRDIDNNKLLTYGSSPTPSTSEEVDVSELPMPKVIVVPDVSAMEQSSIYNTLKAHDDIRLAVSSMQLALRRKGATVIDYVKLYDDNPTTKDESELLSNSKADVAMMLSTERTRGQGGNGVKLYVKILDLKTNKTVAQKKVETRYFRTADYEKLYSFAATRALSEDFIAEMKSAEVKKPQSEPTLAKKDDAESMKILDPIDTNLPKSTIVAENTFAVIIGNEVYKYVAKVPFAVNDAKIFAKYCHTTLGLPDDNVRVYSNATYGDMLDAIDDIKAISEVYNGNIKVIFYYAGHGVPDESSKSAYLLPVDARNQQIKTCYPVAKLYAELGGLKAQSVTVFLDACFSGSLRGDGMLMSARGVAIKARPDEPKGNMVVFTAASGDETAYPYESKGHGLFTYFLLSKLQESGGNVSLGELSDYIDTNVRQNSVKVNRKMQTPTISVSPDIASSWRTISLVH